MADELGGAAGRVLLVEDEPDIGRALSAALEQGRYVVEWVRTGGDAIGAVERRPPEIVLLDLGLPDLDGIDVCRALRARLVDSLVVVVTARDAEVDVVVALEAGADDYLVKPVGSAELLARLRAHRRRRGARSGEAAELRYGPLVVSPLVRRARVGGVELDLRPKQFDLLLRLAQAEGAAVSRETLMRDVWDEHWFGSTKTLDVHVAGLRRALSDAAREAGVAEPRLTTLRGFGHRLEA